VREAGAGAPGQSRLVESTTKVVAMVSTDMS
jgi:hypothetical protein